MKPYQKLPIASLIKKTLPKPTFELSDKQIEKLKNFSDIVLSILSIATIASMIIVAPNALKAFDIFQKQKGGKKLKYKEKEQKVIRAFYYLKEKKWVNFVRSENDYKLTLTEDGKKRIKSFNLQTLTVEKPKSWDGKFWQVAADIPTKDYRWGADLLRKKLKEMQFYPLQRTLWIYPYDPRLEIEFISRSFGVFPFVTVMKIAELDPADEKVLKKHFKSEEII